MITLHHLNNSRSQRILWLLEELALDYEIQFYQRNKETQFAPDELKNIHPLGKAPVLTDGGNVIAESGAIIEYLVDTYGSHLRPKNETPSFQLYRYWLHFAEGSLMPPMLMAVVFDKVRTSPMPFIAKPVAKAIVAKVMSLFVNPNLNRLLAFVEDHLSKHKWFAGEHLSGADFQMSFPLEAAQSSGLIDRRYPHIEGFLRRISNRAAYQAALEKGGDYLYAKKAS